MKNEIVIYRPNELSVSRSEALHIEVRFDEDTVWLTQAQIAELFGTKRQAITKHINNVYNTGELDKASTSSILELVEQEGVRAVKRKRIYYNLDMIISIGYRVSSINATLFRIWATNKLRDFLLKGYVINTRIDRIEDNADALKNRVDEIELQINTHFIPTQGIFFNGQVFDAYEFASKVIRSAKQSIALIDGYIDESTLTLLAKKGEGVKVLLLTGSVDNRLRLDIQKANAQYGDFDAKHFTLSHDRFLIIDNGRDVYHIGASLKDLGKKWFAFSKMDKESVASLVNAVSGFL